MYNVTLRRVRATIVAVEKGMSITQYVCAFVGIGIQRTKRHVCGLPRSTIFFYLSHKLHDFRKKKRRNILNIKCVFQVSLQLLCEIFFILKSTVGAVIEEVYWSSCKVPVILIRF